MQESIESTRLGANRTGMQTSPALGKEMLDNMDIDIAEPSTDPQPLAETRADYIREADPLGSVPPPATVKGLAKSTMKMMTGNRPQAFIDKLAERLAYERGGTRLYDAAIAKLMVHGQELSNWPAEGLAMAELEKIRDEEASHAALLVECIEKLGADPTAQTPSADLVGVESMGLMQAITDPRTNLAQTLHALLLAELGDEAGWETLIAFADQMGLEDMVTRFRDAEAHEQEHVFKVRSWYEALTLETGELI